MYGGQRPEAINTRWIFRAYAALTLLAGFLLLGWGPMWFGTDLVGEPWGKAALIRVLGSIIIAAGCCAAGFAAIDDPRVRRRSLFWFAAGHTVVWLVVLTQRIAIWGPGLAETAAQLSFAVVFVLFYLWATSEGESAHGVMTSLFGSANPNSAEQLRSQYEQQIREVARQEERNRLARDLHDSIKQQIFVIQTAAATAQARFDGDQAGAKLALEQVRGSAREAMTEMQVMLDQLRAVPLENAGLVESLKKQCEALGFRTGARVEFKLGTLPPTEILPPGAHEAILRAAHEALANVGRHARAGSVLVSLGSVHGHLELRVQDDGAGFDPNRSSRGQGIANMHARAEEFGGKFELISQPGNGTSVAFSIPYTSTETPREYRQRAVTWGILLVISILVLARTKSGGMAAVSVIAAVGVVRYIVAYRRARMRTEAAR
jgi:signal transduction histidine kinase